MSHTITPIRFETAQGSASGWEVGGMFVGGSPIGEFEDAREMPTIIYESVEQFVAATALADTNL
jgi:hypothetical protein